MTALSVCKRGHSRTPENRYEGQPGGWWCLECRKLADRDRPNRYRRHRHLRRAVMERFPEARAIDSGKVFRIVLWKGCGVTFATGPSKRDAWAAAAKLIKRSTAEAREKGLA